MQINLTQSLGRACLLHPHGAAVIDAGRRWTWTQFVDRVRRLAALLRDLGVSAGDRVSMLSLNTHRYVEYYLATLWVGGIIMPLNHRLNLLELTELIADGEPSVLITSPEFIEIGREMASRFPKLRAVILAASDEAPAGMVSYERGLEAASPADPVESHADDVACLYYTGGTTGHPKGVMLTHGNVFVNALNLIPEVEMNEDTAHLHAGPLFHVAAGVRIYSTTIAGGTHVVCPKFSLPDVLDVIQDAGVTIATFVPTMLRTILEREDLEHYHLPSLRYITYGAAPMSVDLLLRAMARFPKVRLVQSYGQTEASPIVSILSARHHDQASPGRLASAGRPALSAEIRIVAADGSELPAGGIGEVTVRGPMVMKGYWRNPELTAEAIRNGWLHTGDAGYLDRDGFLFIVDRLKDMIVSGGENIYSAEVERALSSHAAVADCAVFGLPDSHWGERVHAVVVLRPGGAVTQEELIAHCRQQIAHYKCPRSLEIRHERLPINSVNKTLKAELRRQTLMRARAGDV